MNTDFSQIIFDKERHTYTLDGQELPSVTKTVNKLKPIFDRNYWGEKKAIEQGVSTETVLKEWDSKSKASQKRGTKVHEYIAGLLRGKTAEVVDPFLAMNNLLPEMAAFKRWWEQALVKVVQVEWIIGEAHLGVAGTMDALLYSAETQLNHVFDWKTGGKFGVANRFQKLLPPFDDLDDCELNVYSLQTSLYRLIVQRNTELEIGDSYILHLSESGDFYVHKAIDLRSRLADWLLGDDMPF